MVSTIHSSKANLASVNPTSSKNEPAEPQVMFDSVKITQDDEIVIQNVTTMDEDSKKLNEHYQKSVNQQHFLSNPHLVNPRATEAEHVAKLQEVCVDDKAVPATGDKVKLPLAESGSPVPKPAIAPEPVPNGPATAATSTTVDANDPAVKLFKTNLDACHHHPTDTISTTGHFCPIADALMEPTIVEQEKHCKEFFAFISQRITDVAILNNENKPFTFLVHIPSTRRLKVCYGMGSGISFGRLKGLSINDKALAISGDYNPGVKYPSVLDTDGKLVTSTDGYRSYLLIIDRKTRYSYVFLTQSKKPPINEVRGILTKYNGLYRDCSITTDNGGELAKSVEFRCVIRDARYTLKTTGAFSSAQNGLVEKPNQDLARIMRALL